MIKKIVLTGLVLISMTAFSCAPQDMPLSVELTGQNSTGSNIAPTENNSQNHITANIADKVKINAVVIQPAQNQVNTYIVDYAKMDTDKVINLLKLNKKELEKESKKDYFLSGEERYHTSGGDSFYILPGSVIYNSRFSQFILGVMNYANKDRMRIGYRNPFDTDTPNNTNAEDSARDKAIVLLSALNIDASVISLYQMKHDILEKYEKQIENDLSYKDAIDSGNLILKKQWSLEDDCCYIQLAPMIDGICLDNKDRPIGSSDSFYPPSTIDIIMTAKGIQMLNISNVYRPISTQDKNKTILSVEAIVERITTKYSSILVKKPVTIKEIALVYTPFIIDKRQEAPYLLKPSWRVTIETQDDSFLLTSYVYFDAFTGDEIMQ